MTALLLILCAVSSLVAVAFFAFMALLPAIVRDRRRRKALMRDGKPLARAEKRAFAAAMYGWAMEPGAELAGYEMGLEELAREAARETGDSA